jgi:type IX secretion system PorP/SprF family membrane protein
MRRTTIILLFLVGYALASGQQLPIYSQYLYNKFLINPAVAGSDGYTSFNLTAREQWVGYDGAPRTFSFSGQTRLLKKKLSIRHAGSGRQVFRPKTDGRVGLGGYIYNDRNGIVQRTGFQFSYSYHMWLRNATQLSLGLAFTGYHFKIDEAAINFENANEPWMNNELRRGIFVPDAIFGVYLLNPKYTAGFSADQLFQASLKLGDYAYKHYKLDRHYYLFGSYYFELSNYIDLEPTVLFAMSEQLKPQADIGLTYIYKQSFWTGLSYRTSGAVIANVGVKYQNLFFGYAFDFTMQPIQRVTYGTHELTMAVKFGDNSRKYRWLDRY